MKSISIRNVPENVYSTLQMMAKENRCSLQEQVRFILEREAQIADRSFLSRAEKWRMRLGDRNLGDAVKAVRQDRER